MALLNFNAATVAPDMGIDPVPAGWYNVMIDQSEVKPTSVGAGQYLELRHVVMDGQYAGRKIFNRLNIKNANATAQEIAYKTLSAICHAIGKLQVQDSSELHGVPMKIKVKIRHDKTGEYDDQNDITAYKNINEPVAAGPAAAQPSGFPAMPAAAPFNPAQGFNPAAAAGAQPWPVPGSVQPAPVAAVPAPVATPAPVAAPAPVLPPAPAPAPVAPPAQTKTMTAKAQGATYESFIQGGWTDQQMVTEGYLVIATAAPVAPPAAPVAPAIPMPGPAAAGAMVPPWAQPK